MRERIDPREEHPCGDLFITPSSSIYDNLVFSRFFEENDKAVMGWAENVLAKLEGIGILPTFIKKKDNPDFRAFWGTITHMFALTVLYARKYKEIDSNKILFELFIQNRGLVTNLVDSQDQMEYLFYNYLLEYSKRGRLDIISKEGEILGELLRLIRYNSLDEFIFALLKPESTGWAMGHSSPTYDRTNTVMNVTKAFEYTKGVESLDNYPLFPSGNISLTQDENGDDGEIFNAMTFFGNQMVGIDGREDLSKLILIDPNLSYEISLQVKVSGTTNENLKFGVAGYETTDGTPLEMGVLENGQITGNSIWFHTAEYLNLPNEGMYYYIKGLLLSTNEKFLNAPSLNFVTGRALSILPNMKYIAPIFIQDRTPESNSPYAYVYDFKVKPLYLPFSQGYLGERDIIAAYYKNNSYQAKFSVENFLKTYLIGYKNVFGSELIRPYTGEETYRVLFKVFSSRNKYIPNTSIEINGQTLKTDVNGEASIVLPRGQWYYKASAENFNEVEGVLIVTKDAVEYIQLPGAAYERVVTFYVRDSETKDLMQGVKVTFGGRIQYTSSSGIATFEVFPGIYPYVVEYEDYYTIRRNAEIIDSTNIEVELEKIPYYNVTFRIRNGVDPVQGASILVTGTGIDPQTGVSNAQGLATGFVLAAGTYHYKVVKEGFITKEDDFTIYNNAIIDVQFNPVPKYDATFIVRSNGLPVAKANVTFNGMTLQTDANGTVVFSEIDGTYNWQVTKTEFYTQQGQITINGQPVIKEIDLIQIGYTIDFTVVDINDQPLADALITIGTESINTDEQGKAQFVRISGSYNWTVNKDGYYLQQGVVIVNSFNKTVNVVLKLITYNIVFTVRIDGQPVVNQPVVVGSGSNEETLNTDGRGNVTFTKIPGAYPWSVTRTGYDIQTGTAVLTNQSIAIVVDLAKTRGTLTVTVVDNATSAAINNAAVTINGETKYSNINGIAGNWSLILGTWPWTASHTDYKPNSGNLNIVQGQNNYTIRLTEKDAVLYNVTFIAKEGQSTLEGASITIDGETTVATDANGRVVVQLAAGTYHYIAKYGTYFTDLESDFTVYNNMTVNLTFIRKTTTVTIFCYENYGGTQRAIQGASVNFNNTSSVSGADGNALFYNVPMSDNSLICTASKLPVYPSNTTFFTVNKATPIFPIELGAKYYSIIFWVRDDSGNYLSDVAIRCNGTLNYTSSSGYCIFSSYPAGTAFSWQATKDAYQSQSGSGTVLEMDTTVNVVMPRNKCMVTYNVRNTAGQPISGVTVTDRISSGVTGTSGTVQWYVPAGDIYGYSATSPYYFTVNGQYTVGPTETSKTVYITMEDGAVIEIQTSTNGEPVSLPIQNTSVTGLGNLRVNWGDGSQTIGTISHTYGTMGTYTITFDFNDQTVQMIWGQPYPLVSFQTQLRRVVKWFTTKVSTSFTERAFANCSKLTEVASWTTGLISGSTDYFFFNCSSLKSVPSNQLSFGTSYISTYEGSNISGAINLTNYLGGYGVDNYYRTFAGTRITSVTGQLSPSGQGCTVGSMFQDCSILTSIQFDINAINIINCIGMFRRCTSLSAPCQISFMSGSDCDATYFCAGTGITSLQSNSFIGNVNTAVFTQAFASTNLSQVSSNAFNVNATLSISWVQTFMDNKVLLNIDNIKLNDAILCQSTFEGSGVVTIPSNYFVSDKCASYVGCFKNCTNLRTIGSTIIPASSNSIQSVVEMFSGCINLTNMDKYPFGYSISNATITSGLFKTCLAYNNLFYNCSKLINAPYCELYNKYGVYLDLPMPFMFDPAFQLTFDGFPPMTSIARTNCYYNCTSLTEYQDLHDQYPDWF